MAYDLTKGSITKNMVKFALPLMIGNILQQCYNIADTLIVGRFLREKALAAVGSAYTLMIFLTSMIIGLCMGSSAFFSIQFGRRDRARLKQSFFVSFLSIGIFALVLNVIVYLALDGIVWFMRIPDEIVLIIKDYLRWVFPGIIVTFLYNYFANLLRAVGNSIIPLLFLGAASIINIGLDLLFVLGFQWGVKGAAFATTISQYIAGIGILYYYWKKCPELRVTREDMKWDKQILKEIANLSILTCVQQSVMNFGILLVQGLVNSFGTIVMAAFAAAVKIDSLAYSPVQDFGNAFSTYVAQNFGANNKERIRKGIKAAVGLDFLFCMISSAVIYIFARQLLSFFIEPGKTDIISVGVEYLHIEGACYLGIGILFLLYGFYRAVERPGMSVLLTIVSLGTRVVLAYVLSAIPEIGVKGIWVSIPIGWFLADLVGVGFLFSKKSPLLQRSL